MAKQRKLVNENENGGIEERGKQSESERDGKVIERWYEMKKEKNASDKE